MLEKWKNTLEQGKHVDVVFMNLSKAFDTINHDLMIAKLEAYRFSNNYRIKRGLRSPPFRIRSLSNSGLQGPSTFEFDQPYKQTESKLQVTEKISRNK